MARLDIELQRLDPSVRFRASSTHRHHTWAGTFHSHPELYIRPQSLEEIQKIVTLARRCRRRLVVVGCGHSPNELTCTSSWMVNLDNYNRVLNVDKERRVLHAQGGIRLWELNLRAKEHGLTMPNLGSIDQQSIVGAIATATHGSSMSHGLLSQQVRSLRIVLANGRAVRCSADQNEDLFRAALVSLGALGIIVEVEFEMTAQRDIEWVQTLVPLTSILDDWSKDLWTQAEFTRVWWLPYMKRAIVWRGEKTDKPHRPPQSNWYGGSVGFHSYHMMLWAAQYIPSLLPWIEWFVFGMQYGFKEGVFTSGVEEQRTGLLMNCLYSQFVNEWAVPLSKGPEAIDRLGKWIAGDDKGSGIPFSSKGLYVHCPIEVRVSDTSTATPRPFMDPSVEDGPTLYLNATLYRPYRQDPPCRPRYYEAFEWLMKDLGGRPHWAKNFDTVTQPEVARMYGRNLDRFLQVRAECDPDGMFVGDWQRRYLLPADTPPLQLEERELRRVKNWARGGHTWVGDQPGVGKSSPKSSTSEESFDLLHGAEAETSQLFTKREKSFGEGDDDEDTDDETVVGPQVHPWSQQGYGVFDKM